MRAVTWQGKHDMQVKNVPGPRIEDPRDIILRITTTAICGSDLHIYDGYIPTMEKDDILGHEFMGIVEEAGAIHPLKKGDRVLIPFQLGFRPKARADKTADKNSKARQRRAYKYLILKWSHPPGLNRRPADYES